MVVGQGNAKEFLTDSYVATLYRDKSCLALIDVPK